VERSVPARRSAFRQAGGKRKILSDTAESGGVYFPKQSVTNISRIFFSLDFFCRSLFLIIVSGMAPKALIWFFHGACPDGYRDVKTKERTITIDFAGDRKKRVKDVIQEGIPKAIALSRREVFKGIQALQRSIPSAGHKKKPRRNSGKALVNIRRNILHKKNTNIFKM
jgi:hypothetical protein